MDAIIKDKWINALRSEEYSQTKGYLRDDVGYCCLGVLCDIAVKEDVIDFRYLDGSLEGSPNEPAHYAYGEHEEEGSLPVEVQQWAGIDSGNPIVNHPDEDYMISLADANDEEYMSFNQIADIIEEQL